MCGSSVEKHLIMGKRLNQSQGRSPEKKTGITTTVCRCTECGLIYSNPQSIPADIQDHYGVPPESYWEPAYFKQDSNYFKGELLVLQKLMTIQAGMKSLDIGSGIGKGMIVMEKAGFDAYGLEPSLSFYERAVTHTGISREKLRLGMIEELEYPENHFDFISFGAALEHLYDPAGAIEKALRWLKPGGIIHIEVPSSNWLISKFMNFFYFLKRSDYVCNLSPMHEPYHLHEFSLKSFQEHARQKGYGIAFHDFYVCQTFMPGWTDFILRPFMKRTNTGMQLCVWLRKK
jgi:ubiquinone/menaquinone biosynthesis C-methylase UbiE